MKKILKKTLNALLRPINSEIRSIFSGGRLFPESFSALKQVLISPENKSVTVIDIGVADGTLELWNAFPASEYRYLLIEASPVYAEMLDAFGKKMNAEVEKVFCGDHDGEETFVAREAGDGGKASKYERKNGTGAERSVVPCSKLDTLLKKHALPGAYILKVDVEGAEMDVLRGAEDTLKSTDAVIIEAPIILRKEGASTFGEIVSFLDRHGFTVFDIAEMSYHQKNGFLNLLNLIFIRKDNALWESASVGKK